MLAEHRVESPLAAVADKIEEKVADTIELRTAPGHLVRRLHQAHRELWAREVPGGITSAQFAVLNVLEQQPGIDQRMLGELVGIDRSTIAEMVRRLTARRLLTRFRDTGDGRRNLLRLTGEGATALRQAVPAVRRVSEQLVRVLGDRDRAELVRLLNLVTESHAPHP